MRVGGASVISWKTCSARGAVALQLRRLRLEQTRQRQVRRAPRRFEHGAVGGADVAGRDREQALADGEPSALGVAPAPALREATRRIEDGAHDQDQRARR